MFPYPNPPIYDTSGYAGSEVSDAAFAHLLGMRAGSDIPEGSNLPALPPELLNLIAGLEATRRYPMTPLSPGSPWYAPYGTPEETPEDQFLKAHRKGANLQTMQEEENAIESDRPRYMASEGYATGTSGPSYKNPAYQGVPMPPTAGASVNIPQPNLQPSAQATGPAAIFPNPIGGANPYPNVPNAGPAALQGYYDYLNQSATGTGGAYGLKQIQDAQALKQIDSAMAAGGLGLSGARADADQRYLNQSNAQYATMVGQMYPQLFNMGNYGNQMALATLNQGGYRFPPQRQATDNSMMSNLLALMTQLFGTGKQPQNKPSASPGGGGTPGQPTQPTDQGQPNLPPGWTQDPNTGNYIAPDGTITDQNGNYVGTATTPDYSQQFGPGFPGMPDIPFGQDLGSILGGGYTDTGGDYTGGAVDTGGSYSTDSGGL